MRKIFHRTSDKKTIEIINAINEVIVEAQESGKLSEPNAHLIYRHADGLMFGRDRNQVMSLALRVIEAAGHDIDTIKETI